MCVVWVLLLAHAQSTEQLESLTLLSDSLSIRVGETFSQSLDIPWINVNHVIHGFSAEIVKCNETLNDRDALASTCKPVSLDEVFVHEVLIFSNNSAHTYNTCSNNGTNYLFGFGSEMYKSKIYIKKPHGLVVQANDKFTAKLLLVVPSSQVECLTYGVTCTNPEGSITTYRLRYTLRYDSIFDSTIPVKIYVLDITRDENNTCSGKYDVPYSPTVAQVRSNSFKFEQDLVIVSASVRLSMWSQNATLGFNQSTLCSFYPTFERDFVSEITQCDPNIRVPAASSIQTTAAYHLKYDLFGTHTPAIADFWLAVEACDGALPCIDTSTTQNIRVLLAGPINLKAGEALKQQFDLESITVHHGVHRFEVEIVDDAGTKITSPSEFYVRQALISSSKSLNSGPCIDSNRYLFGMGPETTSTATFAIPSPHALKLEANEALIADVDVVRLEGLVGQPKLACLVDRDCVVQITSSPKVYYFKFTIEYELNTQGLLPVEIFVLDASATRTSSCPSKYSHTPNEPITITTFQIARYLQIVSAVGRLGLFGTELELYRGSESAPFFKVVANGESGIPSVLDSTLEPNAVVTQYDSLTLKSSYVVPGLLKSVNASSFVWFAAFLITTEPCPGRSCAYYSYYPEIRKDSVENAMKQCDLHFDCVGFASLSNGEAEIFADQLPSQVNGTLFGKGDCNCPLPSVSVTAAPSVSPSNSPSSGFSVSPSITATVSTTISPTSTQTATTSITSTASLTGSQSTTHTSSISTSQSSTITASTKVSASGASASAVGVSASASASGSPSTSGTILVTRSKLDPGYVGGLFVALLVVFVCFILCLLRRRRRVISEPHDESTTATHEDVEDDGVELTSANKKKSQVVPFTASRSGNDVSDSKVKAATATRPWTGMPNQPSDDAWSSFPATFPSPSTTVASSSKPIQFPTPPRAPLVVTPRTLKDLQFRNWDGTKAVVQGLLCEQEGIKIEYQAQFHRQTSKVALTYEFTAPVTGLSSTIRPLAGVNVEVKLQPAAEGMPGQQAHHLLLLRCLQMFDGPLVLELNFQNRNQLTTSLAITLPISCISFMQPAPVDLSFLQTAKEVVMSGTLSSFNPFADITLTCQQLGLLPSEADQSSRGHFSMHASGVIQTESGAVCRLRTTVTMNEQSVTITSVSDHAAIAEAVSFLIRYRLCSR